MCCRVCANVPGLYLHEFCDTYSVVTTQNVSQHGRKSPVGTITPSGNHGPKPRGLALAVGQSVALSMKLSSRTESLPRVRGPLCPVPVLPGEAPHL